MLMQSNGKIFVGVTGGIGSGKSVVCDFLKKFGCKIINADEIAKQLYRKNEKLKRSLKKEFGKIIYDKHENVSIDKLREVTFKNFRILRRVDEIVHPFVIKAILDSYHKIKRGIVVNEAALILESGFDKYLDIVVLISTRKELRIKRVIKRSGLARKEIEEIISLQLPEKEKIKLSDIIIRNNGTKTLLKQNVNKLSYILRNLVKQ